MGRLDGKVALVTGGCNGDWSRLRAEQLAAEGARVAVSDIEDAAGEYSAWPTIEAKMAAAPCIIHHDVTSEDAWQALVPEIIEPFLAARHSR
ncbi:MAG: SDR family oxidoreductase [Gammaproteobacteria bacterium]|nr:SDR family oxidoreductase [Gammaproteobacteria bacterium]